MQGKVRYLGLRAMWSHMFAATDQYHESVQSIHAPDSRPVRQHRDLVPIASYAQLGPEAPPPVSSRYVPAPCPLPCLVGVESALYFACDHLDEEGSGTSVTVAKGNTVSEEGTCFVYNQAFAGESRTFPWTGIGICLLEAGNRILPLVAVTCRERNRNCRSALSEGVNRTFSACHVCPAVEVTSVVCWVGLL